MTMNKNNLEGFLLGQDAPFDFEPHKGVICFGLNKIESITPDDLDGIISRAAVNAKEVIPELIQLFYPEFKAPDHLFKSVIKSIVNNFTFDQCFDANQIINDRMDIINDEDRKREEAAYELVREKCTATKDEFSADPKYWGWISMRARFGQDNE